LWSRGGLAIFDIDKDVINYYLSEGHSWVNIAFMVGTTYKTLRNWIKGTNYVHIRKYFNADVAVDLIAEFKEGQRRRSNNWSH
jgi:hypothetical protein